MNPSIQLDSSPDEPSKQKCSKGVPAWSRSYGRNAQILLKNSQIKQLRKSRSCAYSVVYGIEASPSPRGSFRPAFQRFRYASSTRPKKIIADTTPIKTHTVSKPLPNGRSKLNPSASIATKTTPLKITGQLIRTSQLG